MALCGLVNLEVIVVAGHCLSPSGHQVICISADFSLLLLFGPSWLKILKWNLIWIFQSANCFEYDVQGRWIVSVKHTHWQDFKKIQPNKLKFVLLTFCNNQMQGRFGDKMGETYMSKCFYGYSASWTIICSRFYNFTWIWYKILGFSIQLIWLTTRSSQLIFQIAML